MMHTEGEVHIPANITPYPEQHEVTAAGILARHFAVDVHFVLRSTRKTADFLIESVFWELKSPTGKGNRTIQHALQAALTQSPNVIFDARRCKMHQDKIVRELQKQFSATRKMKQLVLITKTGKIIAFEK